MFNRRLKPSEGVGFSDEVYEKVFVNAKREARKKRIADWRRAKKLRAVLPNSVTEYLDHAKKSAA